MPEDPEGSALGEWEPPHMEHVEHVLKRPSQQDAGEVEPEAGFAVMSFDGGSGKRLGTGGVAVWDASGKLVTAQALWYGTGATTNNEAEL